MRGKRRRERERRRRGGRDDARKFRIGSDDDKGMDTWHSGRRLIPLGPSSWFFGEADLLMDGVLWMVGG